MEQKIVLETKDLTVNFGGLVAVNKVNVSVPEGEITSIIGPNGAGKTTLFNLLTGAVAATSGQAWFHREPLKPFKRVYVPRKRRGELTDAQVLKLDANAREAYNEKRRKWDERDRPTSERVNKKYEAQYHRELVIYKKECEASKEQVNLIGKNVDIIARMGISRTFQNIRLYNKMTVLENVVTSIQREPPYSVLTAMLGLPEKYRIDRNDRARAMEYLNMVGISEHADSRADSLPYGKQRRLEIARAVATRPRLLCLDEPAAGMNNAECDELVELILNIHRQLGITILLIEHHMDVVMKLSDDIYVLHLGSVLRKGKPSEIQSDPEVIKAYLGERRRGNNVQAYACAKSE